MLKIKTLKDWLNRDISQSDKLLIILATFEQPCEVKDIRRRGEEAGYKIPKSSNPSTTLGRAYPLAVKVPDGWEITERGRAHLEQLGFLANRPSVEHVEEKLRATLTGIADVQTRSFVEEAVKCLEYGLHRSAIVMSWIAAVHVLQSQVCAEHLSAFNQEAARIDTKWRPAKTVDDLGRMKESDFLDRIVAISLIGKSVKTELKECLNRRNSCGHPNSLEISNNTVAHHIEILVVNVFLKFS